VAVYLLGTSVSAFDRVLHLSPQFLALFAMGAAAGSLAVRKPTVSAGTRRALGRGAAVLVGALLVVLALASPTTLATQFFWLDLAAGTIMALVLYALTLAAMPRTQAVLSIRPLEATGRFSYSTYLMHAPVLAVVRFGVVNRLVASSDARFLLMLAIGLPVVYVATYAFYRMFERPFVEHRSLASFRASFAGLGGLRQNPAVVPD
jgi:peptidoglycan/LPS O-acetylase OafA/YrhL